MQEFLSTVRHRASIGSRSRGWWLPALALGCVLTAASTAQARNREPVLKLTADEDRLSKNV